MHAKRIFIFKPKSSANERKKVVSITRHVIIHCSVPSVCKFVIEIPLLPDKIVL
jgi:hypothetical protein